MGGGQECSWVGICLGAGFICIWKCSAASHKHELGPQHVCLGWRWRFMIHHPTDSSWKGSSEEDQERVTNLTVKRGQSCPA